jgi:hypothetical protein
MRKISTYSGVHFPISISRIGPCCQGGSHLSGETPDARSGVLLERRDELDPVFAAQRHDARQVRRFSRSGSREDLRAPGEEFFKSAWRYDDVLAAGCFPDVLKRVDCPARGIDNAARFQWLCPLAVGEIANAALHHEEHFVLVAMAMRRWATTGRSAGQAHYHRAVRLLSAELDLRRVAVSVDLCPAIRWDDQGLRRKRPIHGR